MFCNTLEGMTAEPGKKTMVLQGVRVDEDTFTQVKKRADLAGTPLAAQVRALIKAGLQAEQGSSPNIEERLKHLEEKADQCMPAVMERIDKIEEILHYLQIGRALTVEEEREPARARGRPDKNSIGSGA